MFELLANKPPFTANTPDELLRKHLKAPIPSLEAYSGASPEFSNVVKTMLAKDPDKRYQSISEFLSVFDKVQMYRSGKRPEGFRR